MLLLARKQFYLDLIQAYLKGRQSIFKNVTGQLVVFSTIVSLRKFYSGFNTVFVPLLLLAAGVGISAAFL